MKETKNCDAQSRKTSQKTRTIKPYGYGQEYAWLRLPEQPMHHMPVNEIIEMLWGVI